MKEIDLDELMRDTMMYRLSLENLVYAVKEGRNVTQMLKNATVALQWGKTLLEYDESCEGCDE
jgi:hypothetical protein